MNNDEMLDVLLCLENIKKIKRKGWEVKGITNPESVADHSFLTLLVTLILGRNDNMNIEKLLIMSLIHDIPEILTGDITPYCGISKTEKLYKETNSIKKLFNKVPSASFYYDIWDEYNKGETKEAKLVKNVDKLEMALQASKYNEVYDDIDFLEFFQSAKKASTHSLIKDLIVTLEKRYLATK